MLHGVVTLKPDHGDTGQMKYFSTRGNDGPLGYEAALLAGLARDGGLYLPEHYPAFSVDEISAMADLPYAKLAGRIMARFTDGEVDEAFGDCVDVCHGCGVFLRRSRPGRAASLIMDEGVRPGGVPRRAESAGPKPARRPRPPPSRRSAG